MMSVLNIVSAVVIIALGTAAGLYKSNNLRSRVECLSEFVAMFEEIGVEIRCNKTPVYRIINKLGESRYLFLKDISASVKENGRIDNVWEAEAEKLFPLSEEDKKIVICVGRSLGNSDIEGQTAMLESNRLFLLNNLKQATEDYEKKGKMYRSIGALIGLLAAVILI